MWQVTVICSGCAEESEVVVADLDDVELSPRSDLSLAA
jgi:hypothetical protein